MPELTEVEHIRRVCHKALVGRKISSVDAKLDSLVFAGVEPSEIESSLTGQTIVDTKRWGKYYVLITDKGPHIVGHLGMTGWVYLEKSYKKPANGKEKEMACVCRMCSRHDPQHTWPPRFWKLLLTFDSPDGHITLAYDDARRLGRIRLVNGDPMTSLPISKLGFDPLHNIPELSEFTKMVQRRAVPIKALLLDQTFSAGVGNWVADEVLWHAKIHPGHYTNILTDEECERLRDKLHYVCHLAADVDADSNKFPDNWLFRYRWNKGKGKGKGALPDGQKISFETVGGRTSAFIADVQRLPKNSAQKAKSVAVKKKTVSKVVKEELEVEKSNGKNLRRSSRTKVKKEEEVVTVPKTSGKRKSTAAALKTKFRVTKKRTSKTI